MSEKFMPTDPEAVKATIAALGAKYGEHLRKFTEFKPGRIIKVSRDHGNPHRHPYVANWVEELAVVIEIQPVFVKVYQTPHGLTELAVLKFEDRVLVQVEGEGREPRLLSMYGKWEVYNTDAAPSAL
jgi:hypothetical protein